MADSVSRNMAGDDRAGAGGGHGGGALPGSGGGAGPSAARGESAGLFHVYKPGQGAMVRWGSAVAGGIVALAFAAFLTDEVRRFTQNEYFVYLLPVAAMAGLAYYVFRLVGQNKRVADFLIATEGEMKKVNWSTRAEIMGHTKVVIFVVLAVGFLLFFVDVAFIWFFDAIGVLRIGLLERLFNSGSGE